MGIQNLTKSDIEKALRYIDENGIPKQNLSKKYDLIIKNSYPAKYVVAVANHLTNHADISDESLNSIGAVSLLRSLGYTVNENTDVDKEKVNNEQEHTVSINIDDDHHIVFYGLTEFPKWIQNETDLEQAFANDDSVFELLKTIGNRDDDPEFFKEAESLDMPYAFYEAFQFHRSKNFLSFSYGPHQLEIRIDDDYQNTIDMETEDLEEFDDFKNEVLPKTIAEYAMNCSEWRDDEYPLSVDYDRENILKLANEKHVDLKLETDPDDIDDEDVFDFINQNSNIKPGIYCILFNHRRNYSCEYCKFDIKGDFDSSKLKICDGVVRTFFDRDVGTEYYERPLYFSYDGKVVENSETVWGADLDSCLGYGLDDHCFQFMVVDFDGSKFEILAKLVDMKKNEWRNKFYDEMIEVAKKVLQRNS